MLLLLLLLVLLLLCCCWSCTARELTRAEREVVEVVFKQKLPLALQTEQRCRMLAKRKDPTFSASAVSSNSLLVAIGCAKSRLRHSNGSGGHTWWRKASRWPGCTSLLCFCGVDCCVV